MTEEMQKRFAEFAWHLGQVGGFASAALESDEILSEFVCRDLQPSDLRDLFEAVKKVAQVFYNDARPA